MFCINCGEPLASGARFCAGCGARVDSEVTRIAERPQSTPTKRLTEADEIEQVIFNTRPTILFVGLGYASAALGSMLLIILLALTPLNISPTLSVPLALALLLIPAFYHLKRNTIRYTLTDSKVEIDRGLVSRTTRNIPLRNIQNVTVSASFLQRLLGFGDIIIDDASEQVGAVVLDNIPDPRRHADLLLRELRRWR